MYVYSTIPTLSNVVLTFFKAMFNTFQRPPNTDFTSSIKQLNIILLRTLFYHLFLMVFFGNQQTANIA